MKFDKLMVVFNNKYITNINTDKFNSTYEGKQLRMLNYMQKSPFMLRIRIDKLKQETSIEFTGKVLGRNYPVLISSETIRECFENIQHLSICQLDIDGILATAEVPKLDVTKDVETDFEECVVNLEFAIVNNRRWQVEKYQGSHGRVVRKNVSSVECKRRLVIYNKEREMMRDENSEFLKYVGRQMLSHFKGITRFELNLTNKKQIRKLLCIEDNRLLSVLASSANPILSVVNEAFDFSKTPAKSETIASWQKTCVLEKYNYDLAEIERNIRALASNNTSIKKLMAPYHQLVTSRKLQHTDGFDLRPLLAEM